MDHWFVACDSCSRWNRGEHDLAGAALRIVGGLFLFLEFASFRARDRELAAHERLVVKHLDAANRIIHVEHLHEAIAFRAVGCAVVNDFHAADRANAFEQFLEVLFGDIVGQVADIDAGGLDSRRVAAARAIGSAFALTFTAARRGLAGTGVAGIGLCGFGFAVGLGGVRLAWWAAGFFVEANELQEFLPPSEWFFATGWAWGLESEFLRATRSRGAGAAVAAV